MTHTEIMKLTEEYGGAWGIDHAKRLLHLVSLLAEGEPYDEETVWLAAYLHDWGGYKPWIQPGVDHQVRSRDVVAEFLAQNGFASDLSARVLECILYHHGGPEERSRESILFTDADALDLLGVVGVLRIFAMWPRDLGSARKSVERWKQTSLVAIRTEAGRRMAEERIREGDELMRQFEVETFGLY